MASVRPYINHLLQNSGITPACSEEERVAAEDIAKIFSDHGFEPEIQEFSASSSSKIVTAALGIAAFLGAVLMGIGGVVGALGLLLALAAAVVFTLERMGKTVLRLRRRRSLAERHRLPQGLGPARVPEEPAGRRGRPL